MSDRPQPTALRYTLEATWDAAARRWVGTSPDIIGLVLETAALPDLFAEVAAVAPDLMRLNGQPMPAGEP